MPTVQERNQTLTAQELRRGRRPRPGARQREISHTGRVDCAVRDAVSEQRRVGDPLDLRGFRRR